MIIALCGAAGSGKNTVAEWLDMCFFADKQECKLLTFAEVLKDVVAALFGWNRYELEGTGFARAWREAKDAWWCDALGRDDVTPRRMLQETGAALRASISPKIFIAALGRKVKACEDAGQNVVVTDARYANEIEFLRRMGAKVVHVDRPAEACTQVPAHESEEEWKGALAGLAGLEGLAAHTVIDNRGDLEALRASVRNWYAANVSVNVVRAELVNL